MIYAARYLGPANFGILTFALAFTSIFGILTDIGLQSLVTREIARDKKLTQKYLRNIIPLKILSVIVTFGIIALVINLMGYDAQTVVVVYFLGLSTFVQTFTLTLFAIFQAFERMEYQAIGQIVNSIVMFTGFIVGIVLKLSLTYFSIIYLISSIFALIVTSFLFLILRNRSVEKTKFIEFDWLFWKSLIKKSYPFFLAAIFYMIAFKFDTIALSYLKGNEVVGWYNAAIKLLENLTFIPSIFVTALYPIFSYYYQSSVDRFTVAYQISLKYLAILGLPIAAGTTLLADKIIQYIYHSGFSQSVIVLQICAWVIPLAFLYTVMGSMLSSRDRQDLFMISVLIAMIVNVCLNLLIIPHFSYIGASIVSVATQLVIFIVQLIFLNKTGVKMRIYNFVWKPALASLAMSIFVFFTSKLPISVLIIILLAAILYFGILILLRMFSNEDIDLFTKLLNPRKS